ncbi:hypothetical protein GYMLUDRAFT_245930 [Collybiopsis luxurians FD-317 M1]|uniref:Ribonuclease H1 N-terminal domain-containing protein n=1 Tax=Collybiopsis luxurians FD-317 M1 TaxID=944289 RepID=A0A0D0B5B7_9AGAR|nr:hypothetical protein GYMLUDRAFT_245930 [Collybiopsis luxurians FD-317 M1]
MSEDFTTLSLPVEDLSKIMLTLEDTISSIHHFLSGIAHNIWIAPDSTLVIPAADLAGVLAAAEEVQRVITMLKTSEGSLQSVQTSDSYDLNDQVSRELTEACLASIQLSQTASLDYDRVTNAVELVASFDDDYITPIVAPPPTPIDYKQTQRCWYVITVGQAVGIFTSLSLVHRLVHKVKGNVMQAFNDYNRAKAEYELAKDLGLVKIVASHA